MNDKTNVMRALDQKKIAYIPRSYDPQITEGVSVAEVLGEDAKKVFKTLVTVSDKKAYFVFVIPVAESLDLKKAARAVGAKSVAMLKQKELLPLTGYVHGGCSPVGMKKQFRTVNLQSAQTQQENLTQTLFHCSAQTFTETSPTDSEKILQKSSKP